MTTTVDPDTDVVKTEEDRREVLLKEARLALDEKAKSHYAIHGELLAEQALRFHIAKQALDLLPFTAFQMYAMDEVETEWVDGKIWIVLRLTVRNWNMDEHAKEQLFGSIAKLEQRLADRALPLKRVIEPAPYVKERMDVKVETEFYDTPFAFRFKSLEPGDNCRIEYEDIEIPARTEKRAKVVCDD